MEIVHTAAFQRINSGVRPVIVSLTAHTNRRLSESFTTTVIPSQFLTIVFYHLYIYMSTLILSLFPIIFYNFSVDFPFCRDFFFVDVKRLEFVGLFLIEYPVGLS